MKTILSKAGDYFSLVKFSHTIFAMPFALIGYSLAVFHEDYLFSLRILILVVVCMVLARSAAMSFNRIVDYRIDKLNPRTAGREIPSGKITVKNATLFTITASLLFILTTFFINRLALYLSPVALIVILGYSFTKRFTSLCHLVLGLGLSLAPIGAYIAVTGHFALLPLIYSGIVLTWVSGFDIIYSLQDDEFDRKTGLFSIPSVFSRKQALVISVLLHLVTVALVITAGIIAGSGLIFWMGSVIFFILLVYQHYIVSPDDLSKVNLAFGTTNGMAGLMFGFFVILDLLI
jgi:4-hydroxybenzoate polyprenyltransferase